MLIDNRRIEMFESIVVLKQLDRQSSLSFSYNVVCQPLLKFLRAFLVSYTLIETQISFLCIRLLVVVEVTRYNRT